MTRSEAIERFLAECATHVGEKENGPPYRNRSPFIDKANRFTGAPLGSPWCASSLALSGDTALGTVYPVPRSADCDVLLAWGRKRGLLHRTAKRGDIFLILNPTDEDDATHTGAVSDATDTGVKTFEGNAQPVWSKVLTPTGWKAIGELQPGDIVVNPEGGVTAVQGVYPQGKREVFCVTMNDGSKTHACEQHLWNVYTSAYPKRGYHTINTGEVIRRIAAGNGVQLPPLTPPELRSEFSEPLPIAPYVLGLLLGDGGLSRNGSIRFTSKDPELIQAISDAYPKARVIHIAGYDYRITFPEVVANELCRAVEKLGLNCTSRDKFIPAIYKWSGSRERLAILQGLLDTDGHIDDYGRVEYTSCSILLANDVAWLIRSLGGRGTIQTKTGVRYTSPTQKTPKDANTAYRIQVRLPDGMQYFRLPRKRDREPILAGQRRRYKKPERLIKTVESVGYAESVCIRVEAENRLYVTDDFIITHNTNDDGSRDGWGYLRRSRSYSSRIVFLRWADFVDDADDDDQTPAIPDGANPAIKYTWKVKFGPVGNPVDTADAFIDGNTAYMSLMDYGRVLFGNNAEQIIKWVPEQHAVRWDDKMLPQSIPQRVIDGHTFVGVRAMSLWLNLAISSEAGSKVIHVYRVG